MGHGAISNFSLLEHLQSAIHHLTCREEVVQPRKQILYKCLVEKRIGKFI